MKILLSLVFLVSFMFASIDINKADVKELSTLKGIGVSKAKLIVKYRENHCFKDIEELKNVKGIGAKTIEKNRDNLSTGKCK